MKIHASFPSVTLVLVSMTLAAAPGCSSPEGDDLGSGGSVNPSSGGALVSSGGSANGTGGAVTSSGGSANGTGGIAISTGGTPNNASGGSPNNASGGSDNTGGDEVEPSTGCGQAAPAAGNATIDVDGLSREYILALPENYDPEKPYRLVFTWHPWGGSAQQVAGNGPNGYYGLLGASEGEAILVSPEGLDFGGNGLGWGNENGQDIAFLNAMMERFDAELCFDHNRVFSTGFSFGGMMSNAVACSGLARAV